LEDAFDSIDSNDLSSSQQKSRLTHENQGVLNSLIRSELLGKSMMASPEFDQNNYPSSDTISPQKFRLASNMLKYSTPRQRASTGTSNLQRDSMQPQFMSSSNLQSHLVSPKKSIRKIPRLPFKVLDAPSLADDYYLNLVDWSANNVVAVALGSSVFLWSAATSKVCVYYLFLRIITITISISEYDDIVLTHDGQVTKLCDADGQDTITSITWAVRGILLIMLFFNKPQNNIDSIQDHKLPLVHFLDMFIFGMLFKMSNFAI
jgi:hypothetical protein